MFSKQGSMLACAFGFGNELRQPLSKGAGDRNLSDC
jgi:hypothetical protein